MNEEGIKRLALAIVLQAVQDYKTALIKNDKLEIHNLEKWFRGKRYNTLCSIDGEYLIRKIKEVIKND